MTCTSGSALKKIPITTTKISSLMKNSGGDTLSKTKFSAKKKKKKKIEENYQEITPQIKETIEKNPQKFKVFCLWQSFICLSILKHTP